MANPAIQQTVQSKAAYSCELAVCFLGITLTQWATILGIIATLLGIVLAILTFISNEKRNRRVLEMNRSHNQKVRDIMREDDEQRHH